MSAEVERGPLRVWIVVAGLLLALFLQQVLSMRLLTASFDEATHLAAGYSYLQTRDFRLNPQHPPLVKLLCALPLRALAPRVDFGHASFAETPPREWKFGDRFLYENDADRLLFWGRLPNVLLSLLLAFYVFLWARDLHGPAAGLCALFLCVFSPNVIAHGRLVTFDLGVACFSTLTLYHLWRFSCTGAWLHVFLAGAGLGLALATKFSGLILLASVVPLLGGVALDGRRRPREVVGALGLVLGLAVLIVQASYLGSAGLPTWWTGLQLVNQDHQPGHAYYLMGEFEPGGWGYYFAAALLFKTPGLTLLLGVLALAFTRRFGPERRFDDAFLAVPALAWFAATSAFADNLGVRYLLPVYPLAFVFASRLAPALSGLPWARAAATGAALWYAGSSLWIFPDHLAYFNEFVGGPARGHLYLDDSNVDWGQDLKRVEQWLDAEGIGEVRYRFRHTARPDYYGVPGRALTDAEWNDPPPGVYALSTHILIRGEHHARTHGAKTDWLSRYEPVGRVGYSTWIYRFD
ncbi:MAG: phospholipid carrier-dependent glycosyltransferase [Deltaproteobacteria bacterium]|nr:phospholipid carrier-dependent glycosyltransferase [Deltaproteobacteria bacterium]